MNTYELEINIDQRYTEPRLYHYHIDCEETSLKEHLYKISTQGFLIDVGYDKKYVPGNRIVDINVKILEKVHVIPDVTESIKAALTEE